MASDLKTDGFRLGTWQVRPLDGEISGPDGAAHLEPKVMEVLVALARQAGRVVERETLLREVWGPRAAVSDEPLTRCIAELRRAFGDSRHAADFIRTIPKRGYRLVTDVTPMDAPETGADATGSELPTTGAPASDSAQPVSTETLAAFAADPRAARQLGAAQLSSKARTTIIIASVAVAATALGAWLIQTRPARGVGDGGHEDAAIAPNTIAVLPFVNVGGNPDDEPFSDGLAIEILNRLSSVSGLRVVARTSSFSFKGTSIDVPTIAARLRVAHVLEGSLRRDGEQLRITTQLVDGRRGYQVWSQSYQGGRGDIFSLQDQIANAIVGKLHDSVPSLPTGTPIRTAVPTTNDDAYDALVRGRAYLNRRDEDSLRRSINEFRRAIALDPRYGQPYVELAKAYVLLPSYSSAVQEDMDDDAEGALKEGIENGADVEEAMQGVLALIRYVSWDWNQAELAFRAALKHDPNDTDVRIWYSQLLSSVGFIAKSLEQAERAGEIDFESPVVNHRLSVASMWADRDDEALRYIQLAEKLGMGPTAHPDSYTVLKLRFADYATVRPMLIGVQTMFRQRTSWVDPLLAAIASPAERPAAIAAVAKAAASRDIARKYLFGAWLYLGETEQALNTALDLTHDRASLNVEFLFSREAAQLRRNPRFEELVRAIGLDRYWDQFGWPNMCRRSNEHIVCH